MLGIPAHLFQKLRTILLSCGPFSNPNELQAVFLDDRISLWRASLPEENSTSGRVDQTIHFLLSRYNQDQSNGLVLLLRVLSERIEVADSCHFKLAETADSLEMVLTGHVSTALTTSPESNILGQKNKPITAQKSKSFRLKLQQLLVQHYSKRELQAVCFQLGINNDELSAATLSEMAIELIQYIDRRNRLPELVNVLIQERPDVVWPNYGHI